MSNEEREKEIRKQPIPNKEECLAFYKELMKIADVRFVPYYKMAIQALESQPCEDCISREDALNAVNSLTEIHDSDIVEKITTLNNIDWIKMKINEIPSVTPSRPRGKWLDKKTTIKGGHGLAYGRYGCSVCKKKQPSKTDFCPNCGADMKGEGE